MTVSAAAVVVCIQDVIMEQVAFISRGALYQCRSLWSWIHPEAPVAGL
jgi:hypothetical protein